jgi:hypothetical protein
MVNSWSKCSLFLSAAAVLGLTMALSPANAFAPASAAGKVATSSPYAAQIAELHAARTLLETADHDYKGHRAEAVKLISHAIHTLHPHKQSGAHAKGAKASAAKGATAKPATAKGGNNMPQAQSDSQLKQAMAQVSAVQTQLAASKAAEAGTAAASLQKAVQELQTALAIK